MNREGGTVKKEARCDIVLTGSISSAVPIRGAAQKIGRFASQNDRVT